jgi:transcriptional regulator with XRE-family HTH domain
VGDDRVGEDAAESTEDGASDTGHDPAGTDDDEAVGESEGRLAGSVIDPLDVGSFIRAQRERAEMSIRKLAELAEVSNPYLSQIERGLRRPSADILQQVAQALRISVESLYVRAGILPDDERSVSTVPEAIEHDPWLSKEQKAALVNVYESFVAQR